MITEFLTPEQWAKKYEYPTALSFGGFINRANMEPDTVVRVGRQILIHEQRFYEWLKIYRPKGSAKLFDAETSAQLSLLDPDPTMAGIHEKLNAVNERINQLMAKLNELTERLA